MNIESIGYAAAGLTTFSFIPQVLHILRTRDTHSISLGMYSIFTFGVALWLIYSIIIRNMPMILANTITFVLAAFILAYKIFQTFIQPKEPKVYSRTKR